MTNISNGVDVETAAILAKGENEAEDAEAMKAILGAEPEKEEKPKPVSGDEVDVKEEPADEPEGDEEQPGDEGTETTADYDAAVEVLKRDGLKAEDLRKLSKARVAELAESAAKRQADANTNWQQLQELQKAKETAEKAQEAAPEPATETSASIKEAVETFKTEFGDEAASSLQVWGEAMEGRFMSLLKPLQEQTEALAARSFDIDLKDARSRVGERFPGLVDDATFQKDVLPKLTTLVATGEYQGKADEALADAAKLAGLEVAKSDPKKRSNRSKGTSSTGTKQTRAETLSEDDKIDQAALAAAQGKSLAELHKMGL